MKDDDLMPFGKHKREKLGDVPASYLLWAADQDWIRENHAGLADYVNAERAALEQEASDEKRNRR